MGITKFCRDRQARMALLITIATNISNYNDGMPPTDISLLDLALAVISSQSMTIVAAFWFFGRTSTIYSKFAIPSINNDEVLQIM